MTKSAAWWTQPNSPSSSPSGTPKRATSIVVPISSAQTSLADQDVAGDGDVVDDVEGDRLVGLDREGVGCGVDVVLIRRDLGQDVVRTSRDVEAHAAVTVGFDPSDLARRAGEGKGHLPGRCPPAPFDRGVVDEEVGLAARSWSPQKYFTAATWPRPRTSTKRRLSSSPMVAVCSPSSGAEKARHRLGHRHFGPDRQIREHQ